MKKIILAAVSILVFCCFTGCSKDNGGDPDDNFEVPELTADNTIRFTVNAGKSRSLEFIMEGLRLAVDWGDGTMTKRYNPNLPGFAHTYKRPGEYTVRVWTGDLTFIRVSGLLKDFRDVQLGDCPALKDAVFNTISAGGTIDVNRCPALEKLEVSNCETVESVLFDECLKLEQLSLYTMPRLTKINALGNTALRELFCGWSPLEELLLPHDMEKIELGDIGMASLDFTGFAKLTSLDCSGNQSLTTLNLTGCDNLVSIDISNTGLSAFDFATISSLRSIKCGHTTMATLDVSGNPNLNQLSCTHLGLTSLDISTASGLTDIDCSHNNLTTLDVSNNSFLRKVAINDNQFDKTALDAIFTALPAALPAQNPPAIKITDNPGTATCDKQIATNKYWFVGIN